MRFSDLLDRTEAKELTQEAASEVLGISVRTFQRWAERYEAEGDDGLVDRRLGRRSPRRAPEEELERMRPRLPAPLQIRNEGDRSRATKTRHLHPLRTAKGASSRPIRSTLSFSKWPKACWTHASCLSTASKYAQTATLR
ncbi:hypothetical protein BSN85_17405 [Bradyrhizobium brasilense]|nr:hypothetical protein BSN85_17405 [Bradyrhizobium brasilense]